MDLESYLNSHELEVLRDDTHGNCVKIASAFIALDAVSVERPIRVSAIVNHLAGTVNRSTIYEVVKDRPGFAQTTNGFNYFEQAKLTPYLKPGEVYPKNFFVFSALQTEIKNSDWQDVIGWLGEDFLKDIRRISKQPDISKAREHVINATDFESITPETMATELILPILKYHHWRANYQPWKD